MAGMAAACGMIDGTGNFYSERTRHGSGAYAHAQGHKHNGGENPLTGRRIARHSVRLKPVDHSNLPHQTNYSHVGVAQGIAYLDFGFIEPTLLGAIAKTAKDGQAAPKGIDGQLVTRVAMGVDVLARLHQQIQNVLVSLRDARQPKAKG